MDTKFTVTYKARWFAVWVAELDHWLKGGIMLEVRWMENRSSWDCYLSRSKLSMPLIFDAGIALELTLILLDGEALVLLYRIYMTLHNHFRLPAVLLLSVVVSIAASTLESITLPFMCTPNCGLNMEWCGILWWASDAILPRRKTRLLQILRAYASVWMSWFLSSRMRLYFCML